jgi:hypothetical protein
MSVSLKFFGVVAASYQDERREQFHIFCLTDNAGDFMVLDCAFADVNLLAEDFPVNGALVRGCGSQAAACSENAMIHLSCAGPDIRPVKEPKTRLRVMRKLLPMLLQAAISYKLGEWHLYPAKEHLDCRACIRDWKRELAAAGKLPVRLMEKMRDKLLRDIHSKGTSDMLPVRALDADHTGIPGVVVYIPGWEGYPEGRIFILGLPPGGPLERPFCAVTVAARPEIREGIVEPDEALREAVCAWIRLNRKALEKYQKAETVKAQEIVRGTFRKITEASTEDDATGI